MARTRRGGRSQKLTAEQYKALDAWRRRKGWTWEKAWFEYEKKQYPSKQARLAAKKNDPRRLRQDPYFHDVVAAIDRFQPTRTLPAKGRRLASSAQQDGLPTIPSDV